MPERRRLGPKIIVIHATDQIPGGRQMVIDMNHQRRGRGLGQGVGHDRAIFFVDDHHLGFAMIQDESDGGRVQACVDAVQNRAGHRHAVMAIQHRRGIRQHRRNRVANPDAAFA